jgi:sulfide:quinone oxidoreductase
MSRVLVLGAGFGGISAALRLRERLTDADEVVLVDRRSSFVMGLRKTWEVVGMAPLADGERPLAALSSRGVTVRQGTVAAIDPVVRTVSVDGETLSADALVVALGAQLQPALVPGLTEHGIDVWDRAEASVARVALSALTRGRLLIGVFGTPYACPPGPYELALLAHDTLARRTTSVEVEVFTPTPIALPVIGPDESRKLEQLVADAGIDLRLSHQATEVTAGAVHFADGSKLPFDLLLAVPPHRCPDLVVEAGLAEAGGWVKVDAATMATPFERVYAVGDCTVIPLAHGLPLPKAGAFAEQQGEVAGERIAAELAGDDPTAEFGGEGVCFVETGGREGASVRGNFYAVPPRVSLSAPSAAERQAKLAWEAVRLDRWFGG